MQPCRGPPSLLGRPTAGRSQSQLELREEGRLQGRHQYRSAVTPDHHQLYICQQHLDIQMDNSVIWDPIGSELYLTERDKKKIE